MANRANCTSKLKSRRDVVSDVATNVLTVLSTVGTVSDVAGRRLRLETGAEREGWPLSEQEARKLQHTVAVY